DAAVLTHAVQLTFRAPPQAMRCEIWVGAEIAGMPPRHQIEHGDQMARVWILAVDPVAIDRNIGGPMIRRYRQLMNTRRKCIKCERGCICPGVEEQDLIADLVDRNESMLACRKVRIFHRMLLNSQVGGCCVC